MQKHLQKMIYDLLERKWNSLSSQLLRLTNLKFSLISTKCSNTYLAWESYLTDPPKESIPLCKLLNKNVNLAYENFS